MKRLLLAVPAALLLAAPAQAVTTLRLDGIGPLELGMGQSAALNTGWLSDRQTGCRLGGKPYPVGFALDGKKAPKGIRARVEFNGGRLTTVTATGGVKTATGVVPGQTTWAGMASRYRNAGYKVSARYDDVFQGTFVHVRRKGEAVMTGFAETKVLSMIGIPYIPLCE